MVKHPTTASTVQDFARGPITPRACGAAPNGTAEMLREMKGRGERHEGKSPQGIARATPTALPTLADLGIT
jgi:hypothetical protein